MNSSYRVTDASAFSPFDVGTPAVQRVPPGTLNNQHNQQGGASKRKQDLSGGPTPSRREAFNVYVEPTLHGRRVDPVTRLVSPAITPLPVEPHAFTLGWESLTYKKSLDERCEQLRAERRKRNASGEASGTTPAKVPNGGARVLLPTKTAAAASSTTPVPKKGLGVLHPVQQEVTHTNGTAAPKAAVSSSSPSAATSAVPGAPLVSGKETALVRLSSGKIVRVAMDLLQQQGLVTTTASTLRPIMSTTAPSSVLASPPPLRTDPTTLTKALERISTPPSSVVQQTRLVLPGLKPANVTLPSVPVSYANGALPQRTVMLAGAPGASPGQFQHIVLQNGHQRPQQGQQVITMSSAQATSLIQSSSVVVSGSNSTLAPGQRLVKIRAYAGPNGKKEGLASSSSSVIPTSLSTLLPVTPAPQSQQQQQQQRLSQQLSSIVPVSGTSTSPSSKGSVVGLPNGATATPVRIRYIQHPNQGNPQPSNLVAVSAAAATNGISTSSVTGGNSGIKLSMALNSMGGDRLIVLSPKVVPPGSNSGTTAVALPSGIRTGAGGPQYVSLPPGARLIAASGLPPGAKVVTQQGQAVSIASAMPSFLTTGGSAGGGGTLRKIQLPTTPIALPTAPAPIKLPTVALPKEPVPQQTVNK